MVLQSNGYGIGEQWLWCCRITVTMLQSSGYDVAGERVCQ
jgi:hypothetical protein